MTFSIVAEESTCRINQVFAFFVPRFCKCLTQEKLEISPCFVNDISVPQICTDKPVHRRVENKFRKVDIGD